MSLPRSAGALVCCAALSMLLLQPGRAQEKGNPILDRVKADLKDPSKPFTMLVHLEVKEGSGEKFERTFAKAIAPTRREKGCLAYELSRDAQTGTRYLVYERWQGLSALEAHLGTAHIKTLLGEVGELLAGASEVRVLLPAGE